MYRRTVNAWPSGDPVVYWVLSCQLYGSTVQNFDGFLYDNATTEDPDNQVYIYVIDSTGHGTRMASLAAGYYFGVAKMAKLVIVKVSGFTGPRTTLWELVKGLAYGAHNVVDRGLSGCAVFSMSINKYTLL